MAEGKLATAERFGKTNRAKKKKNPKQTKNKNGNTHFGCRTHSTSGNEALFLEMKWDYLLVVMWR